MSNDTSISRFSLKVIISITSITVIIIRFIKPELHIDMITLGLLIFAAIPWLSELISSAELPGGWKVQFREIADKQNLQEQEIDTLKFIVGHFVADSEHKHLEVLASNDPFLFEKNPAIEFFKNELRRLRSIGFIEVFTGKNISEVLRKQKGNLKDDIRLTQAGKDYLSLVE
jgi:hypothetical protein